MTPFNPLDKQNLAISIANALDEAEPVALDKLERFEGAGVYAIYYLGGFLAYRPTAECNRVVLNYPIYVGKASSKGARKGAFDAAEPSGAPLYNRLRQHSRSIEQAVNLDISDLFCKYLVVDDLWVALGESLLIARHAPIWNVLVEGFGNHDPGSGRHAGMRPKWDTLHPGRLWADQLRPNAMSAQQIHDEALNYLVERYEGISYTFSDSALKLRRQDDKARRDKPFGRV
ncbi:Eco29kI family restriction endonuclease [Berryella wangjianweii]|uniref:Eco29kI family restriction endonuclease n=1 Tax=Berryella wangjianweii TaxID=2734634 RepID=A0A6M8IZX6_9ACTN|nr:Eco29kI family restriction endonuclease [Berryella wangjianweii]QKF06884.1 Eco29kI family restriction endonuclease [Berryella wangjianweii]